MKNKSFFTIKNKLVLFAILSIVPILIVGSVSYYTTKQKVKKELIASSLSSVKLIDALISDSIDSKTKDANLLSNKVNESMKDPNSKPLIQKELQNYKKAHDEIIDAYIGTETGQMIMSVDQQLPDGFDPRKRPWYQAAVAHKGSLITTQPYVDTVTKKVVVTLAKELEDGSGVIGIDLNLDSLSEQIKVVKIGETGYSTLLDNEHHYIVHPTIHSGVEGKGAMIKQLFKEPTGQFQYSLNGKDVEFIFTTNQLTGWKIAGVFPIAEIDSKTNDILFTTVIIVIASLILFLMIAFLLIRSITKPIGNLMNFTNKVIQGDLTEKIDVKNKDEIGQLSHGFNQMIESLSSVISGVGESISQLAASAEEMSASAEQTSKATEQISASIQEVASGSEQQVDSVGVSSKSINEMASGIQEIANKAQSVSATASKASDSAIEGNTAIQASVNQMKAIHSTINEMTQSIQGLGAQSQEIGQIVEVITAIAGQTNLLALNAAIEAARAGEHGKGFAVVADEVRKLAEQSSQSAQQITALIQSIQAETNKVVLSIETGTNEVKTGIDVVNLAGESFEKIQHSVNEVADQIQGVSAASLQMAGNTDQVINAIEQISLATEATASGTQNVSAAAQEQLASMEEITSSAASLSKMAEELQELISKFKV